MAAAHSLVRMLATWVRLSFSSASLAMVVVAIVVADAVSLTGMVILLKCVGDGGVDG